jgi:hypothetical protein
MELARPVGGTQLTVEILGDARLLHPVAWREAVVDVEVLSGRLGFFRRLLQAQTAADS